MKKFIISAAFALFAFVNTTSAQTGTANVNITLSNVLSMTLGTSSVDMTFDNETKYTNGITTLAADQIVVVASRGYTVSAKAGTITAGMDASAVEITTAIGTGNTGSTSGKTYVTNLTLPATAATAVPVVTSTTSSWNGANSTNKFNVTYKVGANGQFAGKATGNYTIPVVYTVTNP